MFSSFSKALLLSAFMVPAAHAGVIFSDNFDANALDFNLIPAGWSVTEGTVDIIGNPGFFDLIPGNGRYIDLDGSTSNSGILSKSLDLIAGTLYTASFDLAGNHRGGSDSVTVKFGTETLSLSAIPSAQGLTNYSITFNPLSSGSYVLSFENAGGDNVGALLDNVSVSAVPVPGAVWLFGSALIGMLGIKRKAA